MVAAAGTTVASCRSFAVDAFVAAAAVVATIAVVVAAAAVVVAGLVAVAAPAAVAPSCDRHQDPGQYSVAVVVAVADLAASAETHNSLFTLCTCMVILTRIL